MSVRLPRARALAIAATACLAGAAAAPSPAAAIQGPPQTSIFAAGAYAIAHGGNAVDPAGANDWSCKPTAAHPRPVVLVHGTWANAYNDWAYLSPKLKASGLCVFALNYGGTNPKLGINATGPIKESGRQLGVFVDRVLAATGAAQVDLVGHSQGGMMPRAYLKWWGGADPADPAKNKVRALVSLAGSHNGVGRVEGRDHAKAMARATSLVPFIGQAAADQQAGSPFLKALDAGGQTQPGVVYTAIATRFDEIVTPWRSGHISDNRAGAEVHNITLQHGCPTNFADHINIVYGARALWFVKAALGLPRSRTPTCDVQLPVI